MAEAPKATKEAALKNLDAQFALAEKDSGKPNRNPWIFVNNELNPLKVKVQNGDPGANEAAVALKYKSTPLDPAKEPAAK